MINFTPKLYKYLEPIYHEKTAYIISTLEAYASSLNIMKTTVNHENWYRQLRLYSVYPDGVIYDPGLPPLQNLKRHLAKVRRLNFNAMHILPFFESPMVDKGYDVSDFFKVRASLGTMADLAELKQAAEEAGINLFMDLVVNHVSDQHDWFKMAQAGDGYYRNFFTYSRERPDFLKKVNRKNRVVAVYRVAGEEVEVVIAFPELTGELPHWRAGSDGYWYYHTFYPQEIDLNWMNPEVFIQFGRIIMFWASQGFHFRLDAILFVGKTAYKAVDRDNSNTHRIAAALRCLSERIHIFAANIVETYESLPAVIEYFGTEEDKVAQLSYNFHLCTKIWLSLCKDNVNFLWYVLNAEKHIPIHAQWLNFMRNHDELSLAYLTSGLTHDIQRQLLPFGRNFNEGHGICGRTFALLGGQPRKYSMAMFLLASFPGGFMLLYGDEIGVPNVELEAIPEAGRADLRNISRGVLSGADYAAPRALASMAFISALLGARRDLAPYFEAWPERLGDGKEVYSAIHRSGQGRLLVYVNLSARRRVRLGPFRGLDSAFTVNEVWLRGNKLILGPWSGLWLVSR